MPNKINPQASRRGRFLSMAAAAAAVVSLSRLAFADADAAVTDVARSADSHAPHTGGPARSSSR
jgi:hypothetical protein